MKGNERVILDATKIDIVIKRLTRQLIEKHTNFSDTAIIGLQPRGINLATRIKQELLNLNFIDNILCGSLDITFHRDDYRRREKLLIPSKTDIDFVIENKNIILIDDVLFTGRTIRAGLTAMLDFGRPKSVELLTLIDRKYKRDLPIQADYIGMSVHSFVSERVEVNLKETDGKDLVTLYTEINE